MSGLLTLDLAQYAPREEIVIYDIKDNLFHGLILREKEYRAFIKENDWSKYAEKHVGIICSADAIVPTWAYMLLTVSLGPHAKSIHFADSDGVLDILFKTAIENIDYDQYIDQRVVVKGCGEIHIPESAFVSFTAKLHKVAKSIMYGEPCSTVPIFKRKA